LSSIFAGSVGIGTYTIEDRGGGSDASAFIPPILANLDEGCELRAGTPSCQLANFAIPLRSAAGVAALPSFEARSAPRSYPTAGGYARSWSLLRLTAPIASGGSEFAGWDLHPLENAAFATAHPHSRP
jgi:hypothetical protein